jgi:radical SAM domain protein
MNPSYRIVEIFRSLQGEGWNTGMDAVFIRFGKCNLACHWCDTDYHRYGMRSLDDILSEVLAHDTRNIIITGGEPTIQPKLEVLLDELKRTGRYLAIETNALKEIPPQIDYIAASPKRLYREAYAKRCISYADEVRIVADDDSIPEFCAEIESRIRAERYYLSPCEQNGQMNLLPTLRLLGELNERPGKPHWQLSIQTHKLAGIE